MLRRRSYPRPVASTPGTSELGAIEAEVRTHPHGRVPRDLRRRQLLAVAELADLYTALILPGLDGLLGWSASRDPERPTRSRRGASR